MRVLGAVSLGGAGHLGPLVPLLTAARERGDDVLVAGPPAVRELVETAGFALHPGGEPSAAEVAAIREQLPLASPEEASRLGNRELFGRLATAAMLPALDRLWGEWSPELVLREPAEYASAVLAARTGTPVAQVAISLAAAEAGSIDVAAPALDANMTGLADAVRAQPYLTRFPVSLDPPRFAWTARYRVPRPPAPPLPPWWPAAVGGPVVYASLGTVLGHMTLAADAYRLLVAAFADVPARVLLTTGRRFDRALLPPLPPHVHAEAWVDQDDVLDHADLVVGHGGSGTTLGALAAGVPLVLLPLFADQFENAARVAAAGAGIAVVAPDGARRPPGDHLLAPLAAAITTVLADRSYARQAQQIAAEIATAPAPEDVLAPLAPVRSERAAR